MYFRIGLENNLEGRSLAWVLDHPGCFAYGQDGSEAFANAPAAIQEYAGWIAAHGVAWQDPESIQLAVEETWDVYTIGPDYEPAETGYEVNAWFRHDWKSLSAGEIERDLVLLAWSREDLLASVQGLSDEEMHVELSGERWDIAGVLRHVGGAEWWYLDRLGLAFPRREVPEAPFERLALVRARLEEVLPTLAGLVHVVGVDGELWSPRKLLRRALWHERDHTGHIHKLKKIIKDCIHQE
jgi:predicted RNase H-like HicB family nuclease